MSDQVAQPEMSQHLEFYNAGLKQAESGLVFCLTLRKQVAGCRSNTEFLAKLYCVRNALDMVFSDAENRNYFASMVRMVIGSLLIRAGKDPDIFYASYDEMIIYANDHSHLAQIKEELGNTTVKCFAFYDVVLDFMILEGFDFLDNLPAAVSSTLQNFFVPNLIKETTLSTLVLAGLCAKKAILMHPDGFLSRFYSISETVAPLMAWGLLGPDSELKTSCVYFKDMILGFFRDMFSFTTARYTTVEALAEDIVTLAKQRFERAAEDLSSCN